MQENTIDGLVEMFEQRGWILGHNLFIFFYSSQSHIELGEDNIKDEIAKKMDAALNIIPKDSKIDFIGHSLGHFINIGSHSHPISFKGLQHTIDASADAGKTRQMRDMRFFNSVCSPSQTY